MHQCVDTAAYTDRVSSYYQSTVFTFLNCRNFGNCGNEDGAVDAGLNQNVLDGGIYINIALLTAYYTQAASILIVWVQVLVIFHVDALI